MFNFDPHHNVLNLKTTANHAMHAGKTGVSSFGRGKDGFLP